MKKNKILALSMGTIMGLSLILGGCGKEEQAEPDTRMLPTTIGMANVTNITMVNLEGKVQSDLTGEWVEPEINERKPVAIMINNIGEAMPQSGIARADIIYEMIVEGGITRLEAVFSDYSGLTKIGPVRSARQYYVRNAEQLDAIFCHIGTSTLADEELATSPVVDMDGMGGVGNYLIYRSNDRVAPHNAYTSEEAIEAAIEYKGVDMSRSSNYNKMFSFSTSVKDIEGGTTANKITTAFNTGRAPWFEYNAEEHQYYRFQYGDKQIDDQTGEQLHFQNVLVLFATTYSYDGYLMEVRNEESGDGYYASNGKYIPIQWKYEQGTVHYYTSDGERLVMNPGKTWITYFDADNKSGVTFE